MKLEEKVAIVTGGARGIGEGIARCLAAEGARLALIDLDGKDAEATAATFDVEAMGLEADVSSEEEMKAVTQRVIERFGRLDILINNAGGGRDANSTGIGGPFTRIDQGAWDEQLATNLRTTFAATKPAIPHLQQRKEGSIVNIASVAGLVPMVFLPPYAAAKAGVISLTRTLALELASNNIRVNVICPGLIWTRVWELLASVLKERVKNYAELELREIFLEEVKRSVPLRREQTTEDIGKLATFLCSPDAKNITGQIISVDGGITLRSM